MGRSDSNRIQTAWGTATFLKCFFFPFLAYCRTIWRDYFDLVFVLRSERGIILDTQRNLYVDKSWKMFQSIFFLFYVVISKKNLEFSRFSGRVGLKNSIFQIKKICSQNALKCRNIHLKSTYFSSYGGGVWHLGSAALHCTCTLGQPDHAS